MPVTQTSQIAEIPGVSGRMLTALSRAGLNIVADLLHHFPFRYEDRRRFEAFPREERAEPVCLHGWITDAGVKKMGYRKFVEIRVEADPSNGLMAPVFGRFFNMPWLAKSFAAGMEIVMYGKVKGKRAGLTMDHPDYEIIDPDKPEDESVHMGRIVPVYPLHDGLQQKPLRAVIYAALSELDAGTVRPLLPGTDPTLRIRAFRDIHFPASQEAHEEARRHLALEEFFALQLNVLKRRQGMISRPGQAHRAPGTLLEKWKATLPFALTGAQERSIAEVRADMAAGQPMNRLLQGDVGSGKTFVALAAALIAVESGTQAAIMAPTQILAEQHYLNFIRHLEPLGVRIGLRTGSRKEDAAMPLFHGGEDGPSQIIIGTHALLFEEGAFEKLGLVVIDEQHKFGVAQRARLVSRGIAPDVLVMTATPIPRTLALTLYGDLDVSILDEMPANRGKITTAVRAGVDLVQVAAFIRQQLEKGRQVYIVYPLVEDSEKLEAKAATTEYKNWQKRLPGVPMGLLHGRLSPEEKDGVMAAFREAKTKVLVATTVIEVGVDVPNANLMLIFNAERFGLAQLHQLRGRIGRGEHTSYCVLVGPEENDEAMERLKFMEQTRDGFVIAEHDLKLRGPGEILGEKQSGLPGLRLGSLVEDGPLVLEARRAAAAVLKDDPELQKTEHRHLQALIMSSEDAAGIN